MIRIWHLLIVLGIAAVFGAAPRAARGAGTATAQVTFVTVEGFSHFVRPNELFEVVFEIKASETPDRGIGVLTYPTNRVQFERVKGHVGGLPTVTPGNGTITLDYDADGPFGGDSRSGAVLEFRLLDTVDPATQNPPQIPFQGDVTVTFRDSSTDGDTHNEFIVPLYLFRDLTFDKDEVRAGERLHVDFHTGFLPGELVSGTLQAGDVSFYPVVRDSVQTNATVTYSGSAMTATWTAMNPPTNPIHFSYDVQVKPRDELPEQITTVRVLSEFNLRVRDNRKQGRGGTINNVLRTVIWSQLTEIPIDRNEHNLELSMSSETPTPGRIREGETAKVRLDAQASHQAGTLTVRCRFRADLVTVNKRSIRPRGALRGDTITWVLRNVQGTVPPVEFQAKLKPLSRIPETVRFVPFEGSADIPAEQGRPPLHAEDIEQLTVTRPGTDLLVRSGTRVQGKAYPGEVISYALQGRVSEPAETWFIEVNLPEGTDLVPGTITSGGVVNSGKIRWDFLNTQVHPPLEFQARVRTGAALEGLDRIVCTAHSEARVAGEDVSFDGSTEDVIASFEVQGTVRDVNLLFPNGNKVDISRPLPDATVRLLMMTAGGDVELDSAVTGKDGKYSLESRESGNLFIEVEKLRDVFLPEAEVIVPDGRPARQRVPISVPPNSVDPIVRDLILPVTLLEQSAARIRALHFIQIPLFSGAILTDLVRVYYDTEAIEQTTELLAFGAEEFTGLYLGVGPRDTWNRFIRLLALMSVVEARSKSAITLADDIAKAVALLITVEALKYLGKKWFPSSFNVAQLRLQRWKIGLMVSFVGAALPLALDALGVTGQQKAQAIQIVATALRFGLDRWTGQFTDDAIFEVIFDALRTGIVAVLMQLTFGTQSEVTGLVPQGSALQRDAQTILYEGVQRTIAKDYSGGTEGLFIGADGRNDLLQRDAARSHSQATSGLSVFSVFRGVDGIYKKGDMIQFRSPTPLTGRGARAQEFLGQLSSKNRWIKAVQLTSLSAAVAIPIAEILNQVNGVDAIARNLWGDPPAAPAVGLRAPGGPGGVPAWPESEADPHPGVGPFAAPTQAEAWLAAIAEIRRAVSSGSIAAFDAAQNPLSVADAALFADYLDPLRVRSEAVLANPQAVLAVRARADVQRFLNAYHTASSEAGLAYSQLSLWSSDPSIMDARLTLASLGSAQAAVGAALKAAVKAEAALSGKPLGAYLELADRTEPQTPAPGQIVLVEVLVANRGDLPVTNCRARFLSLPERLSADQDIQSLGALAPGETRVVQWQVQAGPAPPAGAAFAFQVEVFSDQTTSIRFEDLIAVIP